MAINGLGAQIPQPNIPLLAPDGTLSRPWLYWFVAIMARTGGNLGISATDLQTQIATIEGEIATLELLAAEAEIPLSGAAPPLPIAMDTLWPSEPQQPPADPILYALFVADIT